MTAAVPARDIAGDGEATTLWRPSEGWLSLLALLAMLEVVALAVDDARWAGVTQVGQSETAFLICHKFKGMSVEWIWWGWQGNLSKSFKARIVAAEAHEKELLAAERRLVKAQELLDETAGRRRKAIQTPPRR